MKPTPIVLSVLSDGSALLANGVVRRDYSRTHAQINTSREFIATLRNGGYAWPGGYPMFFLCSDGGVLSFESARENAQQIIASIRSQSRDGWRVVACDVNWEDADLTCDHSGQRIECAYAD